MLKCMRLLNILFVSETIRALNKLKFTLGFFAEEKWFDTCQSDEDLDGYMLPWIQERIIRRIVNEGVLEPSENSSRSAPPNIPEPEGNGNLTLEHFKFKSYLRLTPDESKQFLENGEFAIWILQPHFKYSYIRNWNARQSERLE